MTTSCATNYRYKVITDPVHGGIGLSKLETDLIDAASFQRLRHIKQLGLASWVYPGATHTRFAHSLGVLSITSRAIDLMINKGVLDEKDRQFLRVSALLHDVGHYPFSHLIEFLERDPPGKQLLESGVTSQEVAPYPSHEDLGATIIKSRKDILRVLGEGVIDPEAVASTVKGEHSNPVYGQLIHSTADFDRMDYLVRDSLATGVPFGQIDIEFMLASMTVHDGQVVLSHKATAAAEQLITARYFMFKTVYLHKAVFALESMMRRILRLMWKQGLLWKSGDDVLRILTCDREFQRFRDSAVEDDILELAERKDATLPPALLRLCRAFRDRRVPRLIKEISAFTKRQGNAQQPEMTLLRKFKKDGLADAVEKTGIPAEAWLIEDTPPVNFEKKQPFMSLQEAESGESSASNELVRVKDRDGEVKRLVEDEANIVHYLAGLEFKVARVYVVEDDEDKVARAKKLVADYCSS